MTRIQHSRPRPTLMAPFAYGSLSLPNRFVMAPMTRNFAQNGVPSPGTAEYYGRRAAGGVGLIITEGTVVGHPASSPSPTVPRFHGGDALRAWQVVVEAVHDAGGKIVPQLWHVGLDRKPNDSPQRDVGNVGPSDIFGEIKHPGATMTRRDIDSVVDAFAAAAAHAQACGFDGVEIHGGHGYLVDQFLWSATNNRLDCYGGTTRNRSRFAEEIVQEIRHRVGLDFPIIFRLSQWKTIDFEARAFPDPLALESALAPLVDAGVDIFHASTRRFWLPEFEGSDLNLAGWVKKTTGQPTITVGSVGLEDSEFVSALLHGQGAGTAGFEQLEQMLARGDFDLVAMGRALISDPDLVNRMREGRADTRLPFDASDLNHLN